MNTIKREREREREREFILGSSLFALIFTIQVIFNFNITQKKQKGRKKKSLATVKETFKICSITKPKSNCKLIGS